MTEAANRDGEDRLFGYVFGNAGLLAQALTHSSSGEKDTYQRLEFLGDRVLGLVIAEALYKRFPEEQEGALAKRHAALVQGTTLAEIAAENGLGAHIALSEGERAQGGEENENILADVLEAVIGAIHLDGGPGAARDVVLALWDKRIDILTAPPQEAKTALQEWAQGQGYGLPRYEIVARSGPDHAPRFTVAVHIDGAGSAQADGPSRRQAEKLAAAKMLRTVSA